MGYYVRREQAAPHPNRFTPSMARLSYRMRSRMTSRAAAAYTVSHQRQPDWLNICSASGIQSASAAAI